MKFIIISKTNGYQPAVLCPKCKALHELEPSVPHWELIEGKVFNCKCGYSFKTAKPSLVEVNIHHCKTMPPRTHVFVENNQAVVEDSEGERITGISYCPYCGKVIK